MSAHITVTATGDGNTGASAELLVDDNATDFVDLTSGDSFVATAGGASQTMGRNDVLGIVSYSTTFAGQDAAGTTYTVALQRSVPDVSAPSSVCTLPQPFTVTGPSGQAFSRATSDITVTWSNAGQSDPMGYVLSGPCVGTSTGTIVGDPGSFTIPMGTLTAAGSSPSCAATLTITRKRSGHLDPAYGYGGDIYCEQSRSFDFTSNP